MNKRNILPTLILTLFFAGSAAAQMTVTGEVVDIIDGKTVVISIPAGKVKAELQYIDVPETGQELHDTVVEHVRAMLMGKLVEYRARTIFKDRTVGRMLLDGVDVSRQLLRDGAAWHIPTSISGQEKTEFAAYSSTETEARNEKRGVWSIDGLKPSWEVRAEKAAAPSPPKTVPASGPSSAKPEANTKTGYWGHKNPALGNVGALANGYNAESRSGYVGTSYLGVPESDIEKAIGARTSLDITYFYKEDEKSIRNGVFVITIASVSRDWRFAAKNDLVVLINDKSTVIGKPKRTTSKTIDGVQESLTYTVKRETIATIANGSDVILKIGDFSCQPLPGLQYILYNLLQVTQ